MGKAPAVPCGRALPMGRCASPPIPCKLRDWSLIIYAKGVGASQVLPPQKRAGNTLSKLKVWQGGGGGGV